MLAIEACHKLGFIHRDIKLGVRISVTPLDVPTKFLLGLELPFRPSSHIKPSDFSLAYAPPPRIEPNPRLVTPHSVLD